MGMMAVFFKDRKIRPQYVVRIPIQSSITPVYKISILEFTDLQLECHS